jgi:hypothetical protein
MTMANPSKNALRQREQRIKKAEAEGRVIRAYVKRTDSPSGTAYRRERKNKLRAIAATKKLPKTGRYALKDAHVKAYQLHTEKQAKDLELKRLEEAKTLELQQLKDLGMKRCGCCKSILSVSCFSRDAKKADGLLRICKPCDSANHKARREKDKAAYQARKKQYYKNNPETMREAVKSYRMRNHETLLEKQRLKRKEDHLYRLKCNLRKGIKDALKHGGYSKTSKTTQILGCGIGELKTHIERQFTKGMSWAKLGPEIHIDHIIPLASAKSEQDLIALNHFTNLRPMWAKENMEKSDAILFLL